MVIKLWAQFWEVACSSARTHEDINGPVLEQSFLFVRGEEPSGILELHLTKSLWAWLWSNLQLSKSHHSGPWTAQCFLRHVYLTLSTWPVHGYRKGKRRDREMYILGFLCLSLLLPFPSCAGEADTHLQLIYWNWRRTHFKRLGKRMQNKLQEGLGL